MKSLAVLFLILTAVIHSPAQAETGVPNLTSLACFNDGRVEFPDVANFQESGKFSGVMVSSSSRSESGTNIPVVFEYTRGTKAGHWTPYSFVLKVGSETYTSQGSKSDRMGPHRGYYFFERYWNDESCVGEMPCNYEYQKITLRLQEDRVVGESVFGNQNGLTSRAPIFLCK